MIAMRGKVSGVLFILTLATGLSTVLLSSISAKAAGGAITCTATDGPSKGVCAAVQAMNAAEEAYYSEYGANTKALVTAGAGELVPEIDAACGGAAIKASIESCASAADNAATACAEALSPNIQQGATLVKGAGALLGQMSGANDPCDNFADLMKKLGQAISAFEGACGGMKMLAESKCEATATAEIKGKCTAALSTAKGEVVATCAPKLATKPECVANSEAVLAKMEASATKLSLAPANVAKAASGYGMTLASAGVGLLSMMKEAGQAKDCKDKTTSNDCSKNPTAQGCGGATAASVDCNGKDASSQICLCAKNPRQPGCDKVLAGTQYAGLVSQKPSTSGNVEAPAMPGMPAMPIDPSDSGGSGIGGAGAGGGGRGGTGGGGGGGSAADKSAKSSRSLDTNILGGGGGGGGGGRGYGGGGGYADAPGKYDKYLPGAEKAARNVAGAGEVTGKMGKSNWEKIHDRYRDNVPKLKLDSGR